MTPEQLHSLAQDLHDRICESRGHVGLYYDATGLFRISPVKGVRYIQVQDDFPNSIVGTYNNRVSFDDFYEDFEYFCVMMGVQSFG
jgi:hypothetical protein